MYSADLFKTCSHLLYLFRTRPTNSHFASAAACPHSVASCSSSVTSQTSFRPSSPPSECVNVARATQGSDALTTRSHPLRETLIR